MKENIFERIDHLALYVADISKSVDFYISNFEFTKYYENTTPNGIKITYMMLGDTLLELAQEPDGGLKDFISAFKQLISTVQ